MLSHEDLVNAFITNTGDWDFTLSPTFGIDEETAIAVRDELLRGKDGEEKLQAL